MTPRRHVIRALSLLIQGLIFYLLLVEWNKQTFLVLVRDGQISQAPEIIDAWSRGAGTALVTAWTLVFIMWLFRTQVPVVWRWLDKLWPPREERVR